MATVSKEDREVLRDELVEIADELHGLRDRADQVLRGVGGVIERRARAYWFAQFVMLVDDDHGYLGGASHTLADTIQALDGKEA
jgi:hypothetical protein